MATTKDGKTGSSIGSMLAKYLVIFLLVGLAAIVAFFGLKLWFIYSIYAWCLDWIAAPFALDATWTRLIAVLAAGIIILVLPTLSSYFFLGKKRQQVLVGFMAAFLIITVTMHIGTRNVLFAPDGKPAKYYQKTLEGFKFSSTERFDPQSGVQYKSITPEVAREYWFWQKYSRYESVPAVTPGNYFDQLTREPIAWYVERESGEIVLFSLPGFDPKSGKALQPLTDEISSRYDKQLRAAEERRVAAIQAENEKQENEKKEQERRAAIQAEVEKIRNKVSQQVPNSSAASAANHTSGVSANTFEPVTASECRFSKPTPVRNYPDGRKMYCWTSADGIVHFSNAETGKIEAATLPKQMEKERQEAAERAEEERQEAAERALEKKRSDPAFAINEIINSKNKRYIVGVSNLAWYFSAKEHTAVTSTSKSFYDTVFRDRIVGKAFIEKVIFVPPRYFIVGICVHSYSEWYFNVFGSILIEGSRFEPIKIITDVEQAILYSGIYHLSMQPRETGRVIYVLEFAPRGLIQGGELSFVDPKEGAIRFQKKP